MECSRASSLLSQYIDGDLSPEVRRMLDEHLAACERCSSELREIARTVQTIGSLERIAAPQGFLARVHTRLDESSRTRRLFRSLFSPIRVKLPLEAIGVVVAVLLVVFVHQGTVDMKEKTPGPHRTGAPAAPEPPHLEIPADQARTAVPTGPRSEDILALTDEAAPPPQRMKRMKTAERAPREDLREDASSPSVTNAPAGARDKKHPPAPVALAAPTAAAAPATLVQLALSIQIPSKPQEAAQGFSAAAPAPAQRGSAASHPSAEDRIGSEATRGAGPSGAPGRVFEPQQQQAKPLPRRSAPPPVSVTRRPIAGNPAEAIARIERWTANTGGTVRETELLQGTSIPKSITVEIPASRYTAFVEGLQHIGSLRSPCSNSLPPGVEGVVLVRITLLSPE